MVKPILKWVGGKTQIIDQVMDSFPKEINNYHELFLGGGSVLLNFLTLVNEGTITVNGVYAYDINEALVHVYKNIQSDYIQLYQYISNLIKEFNKISTLNGNKKPKNLEEAKSSKESYYYFIRNEYNSLENHKGITASGMFIFLNKTCFRGLYRTGPNGFNVPYGNYKNPEIINEEHLEEIHTLIQGVVFETMDFKESIKQVSQNDFVYLDPPYVPINETSFVGYSLNGFKEHQLLFDTLKSAQFQWVMSNSDTPLLRENFSNTLTILAKRSINSKKPDSMVNELLIKK